MVRFHSYPALCTNTKTQQKEGETVFGICKSLRFLTHFDDGCSKENIYKVCGFCECWKQIPEPYDWEKEGIFNES